MPRPHGTQSASWWGAGVPTSGPTGTTALWLGLNVQFVHPGRLFGVRGYRQSSFSEGLVGHFWNTSGPQMLSGFAFKDVVTGTGWQQCWLHPTVRVNTSDVYAIGVLFAQGGRMQSTGALTIPVTHGDLTFRAGWTSTNLAPWLVVPTPNSNAYGIDVLFQAD